MHITNDITYVCTVHDSRHVNVIERKRNIRRIHKYIRRMSRVFRCVVYMQCICIRLTCQWTLFAAHNTPCHRISYFASLMLIHGEGKAHTHTERARMRELAQTRHFRLMAHSHAHTLAQTLSFNQKILAKKETQTIRIYLSLCETQTHLNQFNSATQLNDGHDVKEKKACTSTKKMIINDEANKPFKNNSIQIKTCK